MPVLKTFKSGAKRSKISGRRELIPKAAIDALARRLEYGAAKYGDFNWRKGENDEQFRLATLNHLLRHIYDYIENGNRNDENTDAIITNAAFLCHFEELKPFEGIYAPDKKKRKQH